MDDTNIPHDSKGAELWIHAQILERKQASFIADELFKYWNKNFLSNGAKQTIGRFCLLNGFYSPLVRALKTDLVMGAPLPWTLLIEVLCKQNIDMTKELTDACLAGATRDRQLLEAAATALLNKSEDPRWSKIFESELKEKQQTIQPSRKEMLQEVKFLEQEGMQEDLKESVSRVLSIYPEDVAVKKIKEKLDQKNILDSFERIRKSQSRKKWSPHQKEKTPSFPEMTDAITRMIGTLDLESAYHMSVGFFEMDLFEVAQKILESQKKHWQPREQIFHIELLLARSLFVEALEMCQQLMLLLAKNLDTHSDGLQHLIYLSAKAYHGLEDTEQALNILKAITLKDPHFRDAAALIHQWESEGDDFENS